MDGATTASEPTCPCIHNCTVAARRRTASTTAISQPVIRFNASVTHPLAPRRVRCLVPPYRGAANDSSVGAGRLVQSLCVGRHTQSLSNPFAEERGGHLCQVEEQREQPWHEEGQPVETRAAVDQKRSAGGLGPSPGTMCLASCKSTVTRLPTELGR